MTSSKKAMSASDAYNADSISHLDAMALVKKRISFYLGDQPLNTCLREIVDNSIDEVRSGHGQEVTLTLHDDGSIQVDDAGRGLPTDINSKTGKNGIVMTLGTVGSGGKFGSSNYTGDSSMGLNGVGASAVTATSKRLDATVYRSGKIHRLSFKDGIPGHFAKDNDPDSKFTESDKIKVSKDTRTAAEKKKRPTGTTVRYWSNLDYFPPTDVLNIEETIQRLKYTAFLVKALHVVIYDNRDPENHIVHKFDFDGGIVDLQESVMPDSPLHPPIFLEVEGSFIERVSTLQKDGSVKPEDTPRRVPIQVALNWGSGYDKTSLSFVNTIHTPLGGVHVGGLERAINKALGDKILATRGLVKAKEEPPILEDMLEGLTYVLSIQQPEPSFLGQDKQKLGGKAAGKVVFDETSVALASWLDQRKNADSVKLILQKIVNASHTRQAARAQKDANRKKTSLKAISMPPKLIDCGSPDTAHTELHIVEGDSALGSMRVSRDANYQALLPIRGKIINAHKASLSTVMKNSEVKDIVQVLGAGVGKDFDVDALRYHRIVLTADADTDGGHIRTLLITLFWNLMRPLIEEGHLYTSVPPLFSVKTQGKGAETFYALDEAELNKIVKRLGNKPHRIGRFKGLGEMSAEEVVPMIDPKQRTLRQITLEDAIAAEKMVELAMGTDVPSRRDWIMDASLRIPDEELDV